MSGSKPNGEGEVLPVRAHDLPPVKPCPFCGQPPAVGDGAIECFNEACPAQPCVGIDTDDYLNPLQVIALWNRHIPDMEPCERQLAVLKAAIGEDRPGRTCPFCYFGHGWGHGRGCIRWLAREVIPIAPTTRRSDR